MKIKLYCMMITIGVLSVSYADIVGGKISDFYSYGPSARMAAMGNAGRAIADDATAGIWNPSLLVLKSDINLSFSSTTLLAETSYTNIAVAIPVGQDKMALSFSCIQTSGVERHIKSSTPRVASDGMFGQSQEWYLLSWAHFLSPGLLLGLSGRYHHRLIDAYSDELFTSDLGLSALIGMLRAGIVLRNVVAYKSGDTEDDVGISVELGVSFRLLPELILALDVDQLNKPNLNYYVGAEYDVIGNREEGNALVLRAGSNCFENTMGIGLVLIGAEVDYAYVARSSETRPIENEHRFTVNMSLGGSQ